MTTRTSIRALAGAALASGMLALAAPQTGATTAPTADTKVRHCVVEVVGQDDDGQYRLSKERCYTEYDEAVGSLGLGADLDSPADAQAAAAAASMVLASHFDGAGWTGSSFSVSGADCLGGYINLPAAWDNVISSTYSWSCPRVRHWTGWGKTGSFQDTIPSGNLVAPVNNAVTSIQYLT